MVEPVAATSLVDLPLELQEKVLLATTAKDADRTADQQLATFRAVCRSTRDLVDDMGWREHLHLLKGRSRREQRVGATMSLAQLRRAHLLFSATASLVVRRESRVVPLSTTQYPSVDRLRLAPLAGAHPPGSMVVFQTPAVPSPTMWRLSLGGPRAPSALEQHVVPSQILLGATYSYQLRVGVIVEGRVDGLRSSPAGVELRLVDVSDGQELARRRVGTEAVALSAVDGGDDETLVLVIPGQGGGARERRLVLWGRHRPWTEMTGLTPYPDDATSITMAVDPDSGQLLGMAGHPSRQADPYALSCCIADLDAACSAGGPRWRRVELPAPGRPGGFLPRPFHRNAVQFSGGRLALCVDEGGGSHASVWVWDLAASTLICDFALASDQELLQARLDGDLCLVSYCQQKWGIDRVRLLRLGGGLVPRRVWDVDVGHGRRRASPTCWAMTLGAVVGIDGADDLVRIEVAGPT